MSTADEDEWISNDNNNDDGWQSDEGTYTCWELPIDADNLTDKNNTFLEIENNYFMAWADHKIQPNESLIQFFKCIELCESYNMKYSLKPHVKDTNHKLKLLKYHYNALKYCVKTQYLFNKSRSNINKSYSLLIYGYIRNIVNNEFIDNDDILIPVSLLNLCVVFYNELITHYTKLLELTYFIKDNVYSRKDIQYITLQHSESNDLILSDTICFIWNYMQRYCLNKKRNELVQILWNTVIFLQMKKNVLWFKYGIILYDLYIERGQYENSKSVLKSMDNHTFVQNLHFFDVAVISKYYSCKINDILVDICIENVMGKKYKLKLMDIYNQSKTICNLYHGNDANYELYGIYFNYFKVFLLLNDYEKASKYLQDACYLYYRRQEMNDIRTDQLLLEYNLLFYLLTKGRNDFDIELFNKIQKERDRTIFRDNYYVLYSTQNYLILNIFDLCQQFNPYQTFVHSLFIHHDNNCHISQLLSFNKCRTLIDQFLFEKCVKMVDNKY